MNSVIIICLIYMLAVFGVIVFRLMKCSRKERLKRLKSFKRGKFALIYFAVIPLIFLAHRYNGQTIDGSFWLSFRACVEFVVLKFDYNTVAPLMAESILYHVTIEVLFSLIVLNTLMLTASVCGQAIINFLSLFFKRKFFKKVVVVIGSDKNTLDILESVPKGQKRILLSSLDDNLKDEAFIRKTSYRNIKDEEDFDTLLKKLFGNFSKKKVSVIMNLEDDAKSLLYLKQICKLIEPEKLTELALTEDKGLSVHVFASKTNETLFSHYVEISKGIIQFINRHKQISMDFIDKYPLTKYMTEREIDYSTATIRDDIDLNVFMIGFGKLNESLFLTSVSNNQFLTLKNGKLEPKPVKYHIYDLYYPQGKFTADSNVLSSNLHHGYMRYHEFLEYYDGREDEFLKLVPMPAKVEKHPLEVTHPEFYASIRPELLKKNTYNYIIISFGTDMENIELAEKLQQKLKEWDAQSPIKIFVKVRDKKLTRELNGDYDMIEIFGSNKGCVYNAETILHEKTERMARYRHLLYTAESAEKESGRSDPTIMEDNAIKSKARDKWYSYKQYQRESNVYACLSVRMKLQLCGYDFVADDDEKSKKDADILEKDAISNEFENQYEKDDKRTPSGLTLDEKPIWEYTNAEQFRNSLRWTYAVQEHQRWCANMIANGLVPCSRNEITTLGKEEMLEKRKHGNLTTMDGLVEFREITAKATGKSTEETDVIRYDYQIMDDIVWLLNKCGYKLVKKK